MRLDDDLHQTAASIEADNPGWVVIWGTWGRRFCAFSREARTGGVIVEAGTPQRLDALMRQVEAESPGAGGRATAGAGEWAN
jgi:hypothetical protein